MHPGGRGGGPAAQACCVRLSSVMQSTSCVGTTGDLACRSFPSPNPSPVTGAPSPAPSLARSLPVFLFSIPFATPRLLSARHGAALHCVALGAWLAGLGWTGLVSQVTTSPLALISFLAPI